MYWYKVVSANLCSDYDGVPKEDRDEEQELRFFSYGELPNELSQARQTSNS